MATESKPISLLQVDTHTVFNRIGKLKVGKSSGVEEASDFETATVFPWQSGTWNIRPTSP
jgi:hypothetical protein